MIVIPYEIYQTSYGGIGASYYINNIYKPGDYLVAGYEQWVLENGGVLRRGSDQMWEIVFENDDDAVAFILKFGV